MQVKHGSPRKPSAGCCVVILSTAKIIPAIHRTRGVIIRTDKHRPAGLFSGYYRDEALTRSFWNNVVYDTVGRCGVHG
ncbi:hypothetical protein AGMMS49532_03800 [Endomicrobiia bacterium]|nr:hypothetical protein AGMMS49532_03800 [Endomicrobiia bacterium]